MIEPTDLIFVALFAGVGNGIGQPIGQFIFRNYIEKHLKKINGYPNEQRDKKV